MDSSSHDSTQGEPRTENDRPDEQPPRNLRPAERHDAITERVLTAGSMRIEELAEAFGVSTMTVHRDLDTLESRGVLRKSRGVVTALASSLVESGPEYRAREHRAAKAAIASAAFALVEPGQAIILDDSTTGLHLAKLLPQRQPLTVITNFERVITQLVGLPGIALISLGGQHYQWCDAYMGSLTLENLRMLRADILFMSTPAVIDDICFHQHHDAALIKKAMFESAGQRVLMLDHSKFEKRALHAHTELTDFDVVIVDYETPEAHVERLRNKGVTVIVAEPRPQGRSPA